jgi:hypothetical protein
MIFLPREIVSSKSPATVYLASAYHRAQDNLGVFDAHIKNVVRAGDQLVPFDVIPCHPARGFLQFVEDTLKAGHNLKTERKVTTTSRPTGFGTPLLP